MGETKLHELAKLGQSIWLDYISRSLIDSSELRELIEKGLLGMTSNPTIFDKTITAGSDYDLKIEKLRKEGKSTFEIYDALTIRDVKDALDLFLPVYKKTKKIDGFVSLEVNPELATKTKETINEAARLFDKIKMPNLYIKVPATNEGFEAIETLTAKGVNINVTLIFSLEQYIKTAEAYINGIEKFDKSGGNLSDINSVASVFVSRIDTVIDDAINSLLKSEKNQARIKELKNLRGKSAVANSKVICAKYSEIFSSARFKKLEAKEAQKQRVLWGSTGTKNKEYSDIKYVTELIAKDTVNTIPSDTLMAFMDHGIIKESVTGDASESLEILRKLKSYGIDIDTVCAELLDKGVKAFSDSFKSLLKSLDKKVTVST